jgi:hypothetical protein
MSHGTKRTSLCITTYQYGLLAVTRKEGGQDNLAMFFLKLIVAQSVQLYTHRQKTLLFCRFFFHLLNSFKTPKNVMATMGKCIQRGIYSEHNLDGNYICSRCGRLISMLLH